MIIKETTSSTTFLSDLTVQHLHVFDEILVAGYYKDAGMNEIWYVLVVDPNVTTATLTLARR